MVTPFSYLEEGIESHPPRQHSAKSLRLAKRHLGRDLFDDQLGELLRFVFRSFGLYDRVSSANCRTIERLKPGRVPVAYQDLGQLVGHVTVAQFLEIGAGTSGQVAQRFAHRCSFRFPPRPVCRG
jgi:hypothetical protein